MNGINIILLGDSFICFGSVAALHLRIAQLSEWPLWHILCCEHQVVGSNLIIMGWMLRRESAFHAEGTEAITNDPHDVSFGGIEYVCENSDCSALVALRTIRISDWKTYQHTEKILLHFFPFFFCFYLLSCEIKIETCYMVCYICILHFFFVWNLMLLQYKIRSYENIELFLKKHKE